MMHSEKEEITKNIEMSSSPVRDLEFASKGKDVVNNFQVYRERWRILALFSFMSFSNAMLWITFSPISDLTQEYLGKTGSLTNVNMLATIWSILYLPGTIMGAYVQQILGLRASLLLAGSLNVIGALVRVLGAVSFAGKGSLSSGGAYSLLLLGQAVASLAQPLLINNAACIASVWFPTSERDTATTVASMFNPIGNAIGQILPAVLVSRSKKASNGDNSSEDKSKVNGMTELLLAEFLVCLVSLVLMFFFFKSRPLTPPSVTAKMRIDQDHSRPLQGLYKPVADFITLFRNSSYVIMFIAFSIGLGVFNTLLTLLFQIVQPFGYTNDDAGNFGAILIVLGLVGAGVASALMQKYRHYTLILKLFMVACFFAVILTFGMLYHENFAGLLIAFGILGFTLLPILPIAMETIAEMTYPISEDLSVGVLVVGGNIIGVAFIFCLQGILTRDQRGLGPPPFSPSGIFFIVLLFVVLLFIFLLRPQNNRIALESALPTSSEKIVNQLDKEDEEEKKVENESLINNDDAVVIFHPETTV